MRIENRMDSPWNPRVPLEITPEQFEKQVVSWLEKAGKSLRSFTVQHRKVLAGSAEYEFDAVAEFEVLEGACVIVLVECKRLARPVEREQLNVLESKLRDVGAQKAIVFSASGFQRGALQFAAKHGIATVTFSDGEVRYETRSKAKASPPPWVVLPKYEGQLLSCKGRTVSSSLLDDRYTSALAEWIKEAIGSHQSGD